MSGVCTGPGPCVTTPLGTGDNWVTKVGGLPLYIRAIAQALVRKGRPESQAIQVAVGTVQRWARGEGNVTAATRARAAAALAEWERKKAQAHELTATSADTLDLARTLAGYMRDTYGDPSRTVDLTFTESLHPRTPKGSIGGGRFAGKNSAPEANGSAATMRAQTRDFQRRTGLAQTGRLDAATQAKIKKVEAPKTGGGKGKRKGAKGAKSAAASHAAHRAAATATAINRLSTMQRAKYRILRPTPPPGYHWTHDNRLVKSTAQSRAVRRILTGK